MAVSMRHGSVGWYYGNDFNSSNALTQAQMELNATYIYKYLSEMGWTINAIAGMLGNMEVESSINPGRWQSDRVGGDSSGHGYGLVQWTPYTKYTEWVGDNADPSTMDNNLSRIIYELHNNIQWIGVGRYVGMSFEDFSKSTLPATELAKAFVLCYERPADQSEEHQAYRASLGQKWYTYLLGDNPNPTPTSRKKKNKFNFILFNNRRRKTWIKKH